MEKEKKKAKHFAVAGFSTSKACLKPEASPGDGAGFAGNAARGAQGTARPHLQRPRSAATGAEQAAEGEARQPRTAQSLPFPPVRREGEKGSEHKTQAKTHPRGRAGCPPQPE